MLVTFKSTSYADITLFGDVATQLLKMMQQSGQVPGAIVADDLPAALASLESQLDKIEPESSASSDDEEPAISLAVRAQPVIKLLQASIAGGADVIWEH